MTRTDTLAQKASSPPSGVSGERARFGVNVVSNVAFNLLQIIVNLWFTPYLIGHLGVGVFGIISLATSLVTYMQVLTDSLNAAVTRFLTVDLNRGDSLAANRTFNTGLFGVLGLAALSAPIAFVVALLFPYVFDVPVGEERDASLFFIAAALSFLIAVVTTSFAVSSFAHSRFVARNVVNLLAMAARIGLVVLLFYFLTARLWYVGLGLLISALVSLGGYVILWRKLTPELQIRFKMFDRERLRPMLGMGGWVTVHKVGAMLLKNIDLIIVNGAFGAAATGGYAAQLQITRQPQVFVSAIGNVINPIILRKYAQGDIIGLRKITIQSTKLLGLGLALPVGLACGFARPLLSIWLGPSFESWSVVLIALVGVMSVNLAMRPSGLVQSAYNKVRWPGIAMLVSGVLNAILATAVAIWGGWGPLGVAVVGSVIMTVKNVFFFPIYTAHIMKLRWFTFLPSLILIALSTLAVGLAAYGLTLFRLPTGWLSLGLSACVVSLAYAVVIGLFVLNRDDWKLLKSILLRKVQTAAE